MIASIGGVAGIIAAIAWSFLVILLIYPIMRLVGVLEAIRMKIESIGRETESLLSEVTATVSSVNKELNRMDGIVESAGHIVKSAERLSTVVEHTVSSPLIKVAAFGAGAGRAVRRLRKDR